MMPQIGYGVYQIAPDVCECHVAEALNVGYRMIDTAQAYHNEEGVGRAVADSGISRDEIFLVTKVWISNYGYDKAKASIEESLSRLRTDYIDLILLHQPFCDRYGAYRALQDAYREGKVRAIGVANFYPDHFIDLAENMDMCSVNSRRRRASCRDMAPKSCRGGHLPKVATIFSAMPY